MKTSILKTKQNSIVILALTVLSVIMCCPRASAREITLGATTFEPNAALDRIERDYAAMGVDKWAAGGVTSWESYIRWSGIEKKPGVWDFAVYDKEAEILKRNGLKWVPFLIAGPNYTTPWWFMDSRDALFYRCLEHGTDSGVQSLFNPALRPHVDEFIGKFAEHYRDTGIVESVLLGITGDYGEAIYPVQDVGHWTGAYHQHPGFWAGDREARASFVKWLTAKYGAVDALNKAWGTSLAAFSDAAPFLKENSPSDAAWLDMTSWYRESMEAWADFWIGTTRKYFPDTPIYLCTGGDGALVHGSRFGRQSKIAAKHGAGVRITNEGSDYANNFTITRWVASACKFYRTYFGFEPASGVTDKAIVRRVYNVTASGARQLFEYSGNAWSGAWKGNYPEWVKQFRPMEAITPVAVFIPETHLALNPDRMSGFYMTLRGLREVYDYDFVDEIMAADGALNGYKVVYFPEGTIVDDAAGAALEAWVRNGGLLAGRELEKVKLVSGKPLLIQTDVRSGNGTRLKQLAQPYGAGRVASFSRQNAELMEVARKTDMVRDLFFRACAVDEKYPCLPEADGSFDGVFTTLTREGLFMLNTTDSVYERDVKMHKPTLEALGFERPPESLKVSVPPQSMALIHF